MDDVNGADRTPEAPPSRSHRRRWVLVLAAVLVLVVPLGLATAVGYHLSANLTRVDGVFEGRTDRPTTSPRADGATNILVVATDAGAVAPTGAGTPLAEAADSDTLMLLHLDAARRAATVVSIPRDTVVEVPGHGEDRLGAAFALGGPRLAVETVEHLTGVRVDHLAIIDWSRFGALVDAAGGITVDVPKTVVDPASGITWTQGRHRLDGPQAVQYVRQAEGLPEGELGRIARQHLILRATMEEALQQEMRKQPWLLYRFLDTVTRNLAVDDTWSVLDMGALVVSLRDFRSAHIAFLTMPVDAVPGEDGEVGVRPAVPQDRALWRALAEDRMDEWLAGHPDLLTPKVVP